MAFHIRELLFSITFSKVTNDLTNPLQTFTGHDATETFILHHRRQFPHKMPKVRDAFVAEDTSIPSNTEEAFDDYLELSERVAKVCT